jgi:hypothetical protein
MGSVPFGRAYVPRTLPEVLISTTRTPWAGSLFFNSLNQTVWMPPGRSGPAMMTRGLYPASTT